MEKDLFMKRVVTWIFVAILCCHFCLWAQTITPAMQAQIDTEIKNIQSWGNNPRFVSAVKAHNENPSSETKSMTNEKWATLTLLDPFVRSFTKNDLGEYLKTLRSDLISEIFVSGADGSKVAFLSKTTFWNHAGKSKHENPMSGKIWQGSVELDASSGVKQIQISFPVVDDGKPIGSIVVGLNISKLK